MSPEARTQLMKTLAARRQARPMTQAPREFNRGGGGGGHGGGGRGGFHGGGYSRWGGWGGNYYPYYYGSYGYFPTQQVYFDGVNYWMWNGMQWVRYPVVVAGREQQAEVSVGGACLPCSVPTIVQDGEPDSPMGDFIPVYDLNAGAQQQAAGSGPRARVFFQSTQVNPSVPTKTLPMTQPIRQNAPYHYGRWAQAHANARAAVTRMLPVPGVSASPNGMWYPALSNQLMPAPAGVNTWVVWPGGTYGYLRQAGVMASQLVMVSGSRAGGPTGIEVRATPKVAAAYP